MAYNPGNMAGLALQRHSDERDRALRAHMFDAGQKAAAAEADKQRAAEEKQAAALAKGFRQVWEASPELQAVIPVKNWGDVAPNQIAGMVQGLAALQQREQQQAQQEQALEAQRQRQRSQAEEQSRAQAMAQLYGGAQGAAAEQGMAPGVFVAGGRGGQLRPMDGAAPRGSFLPDGGGGRPGGGGLVDAGPASQYVQGLLQRGVAPQQGEIEAALKAMRTPQRVDVDGANSFVLDPTGNMQRLDMPPSPDDTGPRMSADQKFYHGDWKPLPGAFAEEKPLLKLDPYELSRRLSQRSALRGEIEAAQGSDKRKEQAKVPQLQERLATVEAVLSAGGYGTFSSQAQPARPQAQQPGGVRQFASLEEAERSDYKGFAMINGNPAYID